MVAERLTRIGEGGFCEEQLVFGFGRHFDRRELFTRYARALPFSMATEAALSEVVRRSLERRHAWRGADCALSPDRR